VKLRILVLVVAGMAGVGSSYALANGGYGNHGHDGHGQTTTNGTCRPNAVFGTVSAPQTFTVTVSRVGRQSSLTPGQVLTVTVGASGQGLRFSGLGCVNGSSVTVRDALLSEARPPRTTTQTTSTGTTTTATTATTTTATTTTATTTTTGTTTSSSHVVGRPKAGRGGKGHGRRRHRG
jgi:hypothetical protein